MFMKAVFNKKIIAQSDKTIVVEKNHYFPPDSVNDTYLSSSDLHTACPWKGEASYYNIEVDGKLAKNVAWFYPNPKDGAKNIAGYIAFWKDVEILK